MPYLPKTSFILILVPSRIHCQAWQRGGTGDRLERTTQNLFPGRVQKMVPLRFAREPGVPVGHTSPRSRKVWRKQRSRSCTWINHRSGAQSAPYTIYLRGTLCAPADPLCICKADHCGITWKWRVPGRKSPCRGWSACRFANYWKRAKNCWGRSLFRGNRSHILVNGEGNFSRRLAAMGASSWLFVPCL